MRVRKGKKKAINQTYIKGTALVNGVAIPAWEQNIFGDVSHYSSTGKPIEVTHFNREEYFAPKQQTEK